MVSSFPQKHEGGELSKKLVCFSNNNNKKVVARRNPTQLETAALQLKYFHRYSTKLFKICPEKLGFPQKSLKDF